MSAVFSNSSVSRYTAMAGLLLLLVVYLSTAAAQATSGQLQGRVSDVTTGQPMPFATVYLDGSTLGTTTDADGNYQLLNLPLGTLSVVASFVGYVPQRQAVPLTNGRPLVINFSLAAKTTELREVTIKAAHDRQWQRQLRQFERDLLGETPFRAACKLVNPQVLTFYQQDGELTAQASEPLVIDNEALGYQLHYALQSFSNNRGQTNYSGTVRFEPLVASSEQQRRNWQANREAAYLGSFRHFLASLVAGTYEQEGFLAYQVDPQLRQRPLNTGLHAQIYRRLQPLVLSTLIQPGTLTDERVLWSTSPIEILYTKIESKASPYADAPFAFTQLHLPQGRLVMTTTGWVSQPLGLQLTGYLGSDRLSGLLPSDWLPGSVSTRPVADSTIMHRLPLTTQLDSLVRTYNQPVLPPLVYLRADRPRHVTGDLLQLSGFLLDGQALTPWPKPAVVAIDLLNPEGKLVWHEWLGVTNGRFTSRWRLADSLATGRYWLRAYTTAELGQSRPAFDYPLAIYNALRPRPAGPPRLVPDSLVLRVKPEGGSWVAGIKTRIGMAVHDLRGHPRAVAGQVVDEQGQQVTVWQTNNAGFGSVELTPLAGKTYRVSVPQAPTLPVSLPPVQVEGISLTLGKTDSASTTLLLRATGKQTTATILVTSRGRVAQAFSLRLTDAWTQEPLQFAALPQGLAQVVVLDEEGNIQARRLLLIPPRPQPRLLVERRVNNTDSAQGLHLQWQPPQATSLLLTGAVAGGDLTHDAPDLRTQVLLAGRLVHQFPPTYGLPSPVTPLALTAINELLLTQEERMPASGAPALNAHQLDSLLAGPFWQGTLVGERGRPLSGYRLNVINLATRFARQQVVGQAGNFMLTNLPVQDSLAVLLQAQDTKGRPVTSRVIWQNPAAWFDPVLLSDTLPTDLLARTALVAARQTQQRDTTLVRDRGSRQLAEVVVKAQRTQEQQWLSERDPMTFYNRPDQTWRLTDKSPKYASPYDLLASVPLSGVQVSEGTLIDPVTKLLYKGHVVHMGGPNALGIPTNPLFLIDGMTIIDYDGNQLNDFDAGNIERIDVLRYASTAAVYGTLGGNGVIAFYSKKWRPEAVHGSVENRYVLRGINKPLPAYEPGEPSSYIYVPTVLTGLGGSASVRFYTTPGHSRQPLSLVLEGVSLQGEPYHLTNIEVHDR